MKTYKRTIYWFNTSYGCGAVAVDQDGYVYSHDTAPLYRWMAKTKKRFFDIKRNMKVYNCKKIGVDEDPF